MTDRNKVGALSSTVSLGLLAEGVVLALGRASRREELGSTDRDALSGASVLFGDIAANRVSITGPRGASGLPKLAYSDAIRAAEMYAPDETAQVLAARIVSLIDAVLANGLTEQQEAEVARLREMFVALGKATLTHASQLSRERRGSYSWRPSRAIFTF
jgi:hypothetical protein